MDTILNIITNPLKAFYQLKTEEKFPVAVLIILITLLLINQILNVPIDIKARELLMSSMTLPDKQMDIVIKITHKLKYLAILVELIKFATMLFVYTLILFIITLLFKIKLSYAKALRLIIYCFIVLVIGDLVNTALLYFRGIDNIKSMYDIMLTGANLLTSVENAGITLYLFLTHINPFQVWFIVLLIIGFKLFTDSAWSKSAIICLIYWLIVTLFPIITTYFSQAAMANKGLI